MAFLKLFDWKFEKNYKYEANPFQSSGNIKYAREKRE